MGEDFGLVFIFMFLGLLLVWFFPRHSRPTNLVTLPQLDAIDGVVQSAALQIDQVKKDLTKVKADLEQVRLLNRSIDEINVWRNKLLVLSQSDAEEIATEISDLAIRTLSSDINRRIDDNLVDMKRLEDLIKTKVDRAVGDDLDSASLTEKVRQLKVVVDDLKARTARDL